jgi:2-desacetyl-2-hydroxyethyl bacteriochlorophyllide A dehydrogenase
MKALMYLGPKDMQVVDIEQPSPQKGEVKIAVKYVGICGSDVHGYLGTTGRRIPPMIMGHEFSGEVCEVGEGVTRFKKGDLVTVNPILNCCTCSYCESGDINICQNRRFLGTMDVNGAFCEYLCVEEDRVLHLPKGMDEKLGAMIEPLAVAYRSVQWALPLKGKNVLIAGAGAIGLLILKMAVYYGAANIIVSDLSDGRLATAKSLGATLTVNPATDDVEAVLKEKGLRDVIDVTIEAVGITPTAQQSINLVRNMGKVIWVGNSAQMIEINMQQVVTRELVIYGNYVYNMEDFKNAMELLGKGEVNVDSLISKVISIEETTPMFDRLAGGDTTMIKVLVDMTI